jgi:hypothetical protein
VFANINYPNGKNKWDDTIIEEYVEQIDNSQR